jgi:hypothetical protein
MLFFGLALVTLAFTAVYATTGVDVSQSTSQSSFSCMKGYGYNFAIVRVYQSSGKCDPNGPTTMKNAWNGGMAHVDGYIFPCYSCGNPKKQVCSFIAFVLSSSSNLHSFFTPSTVLVSFFYQMDDTISYLNSHGIIVGNQEGLEASANSTTGVKFGMLWLDIEGSQVSYSLAIIYPL